MSALNIQVGGGHYKDLAIQPVEYIHANSIPFIEGCIIKYATRWRSKGGIKDLEKIKHFAELLIELEQSAASRETQQGIGYRSADVTPEEDEAWDEKRIDVIGQNGPTGEHYTFGSDNRTVAHEGHLYTRATDRSDYVFGHYGAYFEPSDLNGGPYVFMCERCGDVIEYAQKTIRECPGNQEVGK